MDVMSEGGQTLVKIIKSKSAKHLSSMPQNDWDLEKQGKTKKRQRPEEIKETWDLMPRGALDWILDRKRTSVGELVKSKCNLEFR